MTQETSNRREEAHLGLQSENDRAVWSDFAIGDAKELMPWAYA
jgi:hypothetical protein